MFEWTIGSDPEFVLMDQYGYVMSAIDRVPDKDSPLRLSNGGTMFADNILVELNIPPANSLLRFIANVKSTLQLAAATLEPERLLRKASLAFPPEHCQDDRALMIGCTPEFSAWGVNGKIEHVPPPVIRPGNSFRTCGGHIHIGHRTCLEWPVETVRALDLIVGVTSVLIDDDPSAKARRSMYGGAGYFRLTDYGLEYRTPSNFWLLSPEHAAIMYRLCRIAIEESRMLVPGQVRSAINDHDKQQATFLWNDLIRPLLVAKGATSLIESIERLSTLGPNSADLYKNWSLYGNTDRRVLGTG